MEMWRWWWWWRENNRNVLAVVVVVVIKLWRRSKIKNKKDRGK